MQTHTLASCIFLFSLLLLSFKQDPEPTVLDTLDASGYLSLIASLFKSVLPQTPMLREPILQQCKCVPFLIFLVCHLVFYFHHIFFRHCSGKSWAVFLHSQSLCPLLLDQSSHLLTLYMSIGGGTELKLGWQMYSMLRKFCLLIIHNECAYACIHKWLQILQADYCLAFLWLYHSQTESFVVVPCWFYMHWLLSINLFYVC